jgi:hypothetical protein
MRTAMNNEQLKITGWGNVRQLDANERLSNAAPDLLWSLQALLGAIGELDLWDQISLRPVVDKAEAAIAKATGTEA